MKKITSSFIDLIKHFSDLSEYNQHKILIELISLKYKQSAENSICQDERYLVLNEHMRKKLIDARYNEYITNALEVLKLVENFNSKQQAQFIYLLEKIKPGVFTNEDELTINLQTRRQTVESFLIYNYPKIDISDLIYETEQLML